MKLPNGYGSIRKDARGRRRRPYRAMLPAKYETVDGVTKCVRPTLGYYRTKAEALRALAEWNRDPAYYNARTVTLAEIYKTWEKGKDIAPVTMSNYEAAWRNIEPLHELALADVSIRAIEDTLEAVSPGARQTAYVLIGQLMKTAQKHGILQRNPMDAVNRPKAAKTVKRRLWTSEEIAQLWQAEGNYNAEYILILLYTGMRAKEPFTVSEDHGDYIIAGSKTKAGRGRIIPIHSRIRELWKRFREISEGVTPLAYYGRVLRDSAARSGHTLHDTRYTFISRMAELNVPELVVQKIVGHAHNSITGDLYTIKEAPELCRWVEFLSYAPNTAPIARPTQGPF